MILELSVQINIFGIEKEKGKEIKIESIGSLLICHPGCHTVQQSRALTWA